LLAATPSSAGGSTHRNSKVAKSELTLVKKSPTQSSLCARPYNSGNPFGTLRCGAPFSLLALQVMVRQIGELVVARVVRGRIFYMHPHRRWRRGRRWASQLPTVRHNEELHGPSIRARVSEV
jgi:hypothetical protein